MILVYARLLPLLSRHYYAITPAMMPLWWRWYYAWYATPWYDDVISDDYWLIVTLAERGWWLERHYDITRHDIRDVTIAAYWCCYYYIPTTTHTPLRWLMLTLAALLLILISQILHEIDTPLRHITPLYITSAMPLRYYFTPLPLTPRFDFAATSPPRFSPQFSIAFATGYHMPCLFAKASYAILLMPDTYQLAMPHTALLLLFRHWLRYAIRHTPATFRFYATCWCHIFMFSAVSLRHAAAEGFLFTSLFSVTQNTPLFHLLSLPHIRRRFWCRRFSRRQRYVL